MEIFWQALFLSVAAMFPMINPIGHAPMFFAMTSDQTPQERRNTARKSAAYSTLILIVSLLCGQFMLNFFGVGIDDLRIAGGVLIGHTAWGMINNASKITPHEHEAAGEREDISLTPLAIPILSGPGAISLAMGLLLHGHSMEHYAGYIAGFLVIGAMTWGAFLMSGGIVRILGVNGTGALNRILGLMILAIGVNLIATGIHDKLVAILR